ncbi:MAG: hypothetical protein NT122_07145, partial [Solirubrobacterales bacterium]|nr:hypothetical protein [Solirubrobacterales bacterium]
HPNRDKPESQSARMAVLALLVISILLMAVILFGGWSVLEGQVAVSFAYILIYAVLAWRVSGWARGPLAVGSALAMILAIFCAIAAPTWADREGSGYSAAESVFGTAGLSAGLLGIFTMLLAVVQIVLIAACLRAFRQEWQVELEVAEPSSEQLPMPGAA